MADCAGDGVVGGELGELELAEIALAEDQLAVRKQELALRQRKLAVLRQRKGGSSAAAAPAADAGGDRGAGGAGGAVGPVARRRRGVGGEEHKTPWTLMILIVLIPLAGLLVAMPLMHFLFNEPMPTGPCQGICALNDTRLDAYTSGCRELAENPQRLFFYVAPATNVMVLVPLIRSAMTVKAYEFVKVRDWRDALYTAPVILSDQAKASWSEDRYKLLYVSQIANQLHTVVPHRRLFMSATFLQNLGPPPNATESRNDTIRHMVFLRHPLLRLRAQYEFDRKYDKDKGKTGGMRDMSFMECAEQPHCRHELEWSRWGNIQTRMLCGWGPECSFDKYGNATQAMLDQALKNLEEHFAFVGLTEEWEASVALMEKLFPTYFEGFHANVTGDRTCSSTRAEGRPWCAKPDYTKEGDPSTSTALATSSHITDVALAGAKKMPAQTLEELLRHFVWADLMLYQKVRELFYDKALLCRVETAHGERF